MFRTALFAALTASALVQPALGDEQSRTFGAGETVHLGIGATEATAFYARYKTGLQVTVFLTDGDGDRFQTRVNLVDGQSHAISVVGEEDAETTYRYTLSRTGNRVALTGAEMPGTTELASADSL